MNTLRKAWGARLALLVTALVTALVAAAGCGPRPDDDDSLPELSDGMAAVEPHADPSYIASREIWAGLADEPTTHMELAREDFEAGRALSAARELDKSASLFRWGRLYAEGETERHAFLTTAQELDEVARFMREGAEHGGEPLDRTLAQGYRVLADHHAAMALREWEAGEHMRVGLLLDAAATEVTRGFALSGEAAGGSIESAVTAARAVSDRLESMEPPPEADVRSAIRELRTAARGLGEVLGSRRH